MWVLEGRFVLVAEGVVVRGLVSWGVVVELTWERLRRERKMRV